LVILLAASVALAICFFFTNPLQEKLLLHQRELVSLFLAAVIICIVGVIDDSGHLRGRHKLLGQIIAVSIVMSSGVVVRNIRLFDFQVELGLLAVPFTLFWLLGAINSLNLIDGMDGLL